MVDKFTLDFGFEMFLDTVVDEMYPNFKGFARILPNLPKIDSLDEDYIEKALNDVYRGKDVTLSYSQKKESDVPIIQEFFLENVEEDIKQILMSILEKIQY